MIEQLFCQAKTIKIDVYKDPKYLFVFSWLRIYM